MSDSFFLQQIEALWILELLPSEDLPDLAIDALERGFESAPLIELAGLMESEMREATGLFVRFLDEIKPERMGKEEALRRYAKMVSASILAGTVTPYDGAKRIWRVLVKAALPEFEELNAFIGEASQWEDLPEYRAEIENAIRNQAARWVKAAV